MEQGKRPPIGELHVNMDISFTPEQLKALVQFYGDIPLQSVIDSLKGMPEEARTEFMNTLLTRYSSIDEPSPYDIDQ